MRLELVPGAAGCRPAVRSLAGITDLPVVVVLRPEETHPPTVLARAPGRRIADPARGRLGSAPGWRRPLRATSARRVPAASPGAPRVVPSAAAVRRWLPG